MNRNRPILSNSALACIALAAILGGPRLCEASNDFSRRIAEQAAKSKGTTPGDSGAPQKHDEIPSFTAAPEVCVAKPDTDGRWSIAIDIAVGAPVIRPVAGRFIADVRNWDQPVISLHAPLFNATAPPAGAP